MTKMKIVRGRMERVKHHLHDETVKAQRDFDKEKQERMEEVQTRKDALDTMKAEIENYKKDIAQTDEELRNVRSQVNNLDTGIRDNNHNSQKLSQRIEDLHAQNQDRNKIWGNHAPTIVDRIDREKGWRDSRKRPLGPIGRLLTLTDDRWATAVETAVSGTLLNSFIVDNQHDAVLLRKIGESIKYVPPMIVQQFRDSVYSIPDNQKPDPALRLTSIMSVLKSDEPMVMNVMIDQASVERKILAQSIGEAKEVIYIRPTRGVKEAFTMEAHRLWKVGNSENFYKW